MARVSVVMSVYNGDRFLRKAVDSILDQTYRDLELVVIDDGSTDGSAAILAGIADRRVRVVRQANAGLTRSLNRGIGLSSGAYVARMDADDVAHPRRLERQVAFMDAHPEVGLLGTAYDEIDAEDRVVGRRVFPTDDATLRATLIRYNPFFHASVMMRRDLLQEVGVYDERIPSSVQDYELWFRIARRSKLSNLSELLGSRRYDGANLSIRRENE
jgi:glycosyltransferase involved in cell wall biosynthesis